MDEELIERISDRVHQTWMEAKILAGVSTRKLETGEELMVPYHRLSEQAKELDRGSVRTVIKALMELGFRVTAAEMPGAPR